MNLHSRMKRFFAFGPIRIYLLTGILAGGLGTLLFGLVHAVLLVPIWDRVAGGLPFAIPAGVLLTWAFDECRAGNGTVRLREGAFFGAVMWALLLPMTGFAAWSRLSGTREVLGTFEVVLELAIAAATAFLSGWFFTRRLRASGALAGALVTVVIAMAGPVPVTNGMTEAALFVSFLPLYVTSGIVLAAVFRRLITWKTLPGAVPPSPAEAPRHGTPLRRGRQPLEQLAASGRALPLTGLERHHHGTAWRARLISEPLRAWPGALRLNVGKADQEAE